ncbi:MAG TPA: neutral zinc metallopeptidase [Alphaproteobacteria bacterium]|nr:neutral zinc metallopeptidase [Alphaproteobacteria bacterium]
MRLGDEFESGNIEDRRGMRVGGRGVAGGLGIGGVIVVTLLSWAFGIDPTVLLGGNPAAVGTGPSGYPVDDRAGEIGQDDPMRQFVARVLGSTEMTWNGLFQQQLGADYEEPRLVLFSGSVQSACGFAQSAMGPFYCPGDRKVYLDMSFFQELEQRFQAPGDFAQAYVIAHEVGHHVQTLLGISDEMHAARRRLPKAEANQLSVAFELQADCFAGVWAHHAGREQGVLEEGDIEEGLRAATAIGDDRIQMQSRGYVVPDSFTHGSSEQRARWFRIGLQAGDMRSCDTFNAQRL